MARRRKRRRLFLYALGPVAGLAVYLAISAGYMESLFFYPTRSSFPTPAGAREVWFPTTDGLRLHGLFFPAPPRADGSKPPAVLYAHGNAGNLGNHYPIAEFLPREGISVLMFDYRSYGRSDRSPRSLRRADLIADTDAALDALLARDDVDTARVGLFGYSLGGALGLNVAAERKEVRCGAAVAPFADWRDEAADHAWVLGRLLVPRGSDPVDAAARLGDRPLLLIQGDEDVMVGLKHSRRLEEAARRAGTPVERIVVEGGGHNDLLETNPEIAQRITAFFHAHLDAAP